LQMHTHQSLTMDLCEGHLRLVRSTLICVTSDPAVQRGVPAAAVTHDWAMGMPDMLNWEQTRTATWRCMHHLMPSQPRYTAQEGARVSMVTTIADLAVTKLYSYNRHTP